MRISDWSSDVCSSDLKAIDDDPEEANNYVNRAAFNSGIFDYKAAIADYDAAIERAPTADNYQQRAGLKTALGDHAAALADVEDALALNPGPESALAPKVYLPAELDRTDEAPPTPPATKATPHDKHHPT